MATSPKKITVKATPGRNAPVDRVVKLEDLLQQMQSQLPAQAPSKAPAKAARARGATAPRNADESAAIRQLAADLEAKLRAWRAGEAKAKAKAK